jgi:hypothetical protein
LSLPVSGVKALFFDVFGTLPYTKLDVLHRSTLDLAAQLGA